MDEAAIADGSALEGIPHGLGINRVDVDLQKTRG